MSLKVWLPLNKDLRNKGLSNYNFIAYGAQLNNNGKLGNCYSFDGSDDRIYTTNFSIGFKFTVSFWFKCLSETISATQYLVALNAAGGSAECQLCIYLYQDRKITYSSWR